MQIEKINENQLEVTLNLEDLKENNISLHSFMCNSIESQHLFFDILNFANEKIGFKLKNYEVVIEAFSVPAKSSFVLLITRIPQVAYLHTSKSKYGTFKASKSLWIKFDNFEDFCMFCTSLENNLSITSSLYLLDDCYFLHIKVNKIKYFFRTLAMATEFAECIYDSNYVLDENSEVIIKDCAVKTCKKFFV